MLMNKQEKKLSNILEQGSSGDLTKLLVSLIDYGGSNLWKGSNVRNGRAISLISAVMNALCFMRDNNGLLFDGDMIRKNLILDNIIKLN